MSDVKLFEIDEKPTWCPACGDFAILASIKQAFAGLDRIREIRMMATEDQEDEGRAPLAHVRGGQEMGRRWYEQGKLLNKKNTFTDFIDVTRYLVKEGMVDPARVCIVGASYGGYAALAGVSLDPGVYRCAVSVAGISDVKRMLQAVEPYAGS